MSGFWMWNNSRGGWGNFSPKNQTILENAFLSKILMTDINTPYGKRIIDFSNMIEIHEDGKQVKIKRAGTSNNCTNCNSHMQVTTDNGLCQQCYSNWLTPNQTLPMELDKPFVCGEIEWIVHQEKSWSLHRRSTMAFEGLLERTLWSGVKTIRVTPPWDTEGHEWLINVRKLVASDPWKRKTLQISRRMKLDAKDKNICTNCGVMIGADISIGLCHNCTHKIPFPKPISETIQIPSNGDLQKGAVITMVHISDTHSKLHKWIENGLIPVGDILVHSGDMTNNGTPKEMAVFVEAMSLLPHKHKVIILGNHDSRNMGGEAYPKERIAELMGQAGIIYLQDSGAKVMGLNIWGSPWNNCGGVFRSDVEQRTIKMDEVPNGTNILLTHQPALGFGDMTYHVGRFGCPAIRNIVEDRGISVNCFGHVHEDVGMWKFNGTLYSNAAMDETHRANVIKIEIV